MPNTKEIVQNVQKLLEQNIGNAPFQPLQKEINPANPFVARGPVAELLKANALNPGSTIGMSFLGRNTESEIANALFAEMTRQLNTNKIKTESDLYNTTINIARILGLNADQAINVASELRLHTHPSQNITTTQTPTN